MRAHLFDDPDELDALDARGWRALWRRAEASPAMHPTWVRSWWRTMGSAPATKLGGRRRLVGVRVEDDGGALKGLAVFVRRAVLADPGPRVRLDLVCSGEERSDEVCSDYIGILAEPGADEDVGREVARAILDRGAPHWDDVLLPNLAGPDRTVTAFSQALVDAGCSVTVAPAGRCAYIAIPKSFDAYLAGLKRDARYFVKRTLRDYEAWSGGSPKLARAAGAAGLEEGRAIFESLHGERWGGQGLFASERFRAFHREVSDVWIDGGDVRLDLSWLEAAGRPVAVLYSFVAWGKVLFYQAGRATDLPKQVRPGIVAHLAAIQRGIGEGLVEYDFLQGDARYKEQLATAYRPLAEVHVLRGTARAAFLDAAAAFGRRAAKGLRWRSRASQQMAAVDMRASEPPRGGEGGQRSAAEREGGGSEPGPLSGR